MVETITQAAFFEKVDLLVKEGSIKVEPSNYRALDERMTFYCNEDGYFQMTPERFLTNSLGCALCSSRHERKEQGRASRSEASEDVFSGKMTLGISDDNERASASSIERFMNYSITQTSTFVSEQPANLYFFKIKDDEVYMLGVSNKPLRQQYPINLVQQLAPLVEVTFANGEEAEVMGRAITDSHSELTLEIGATDLSNCLLVGFGEDISAEITNMLGESVLMEYV